MGLPRAPLPMGQFLTHGHVWSTPACRDGHSLGGCSQVMRFQKQVWRVAHSILPFVWFSRQCLCSDPTKGTFVPLTTCGLLLHGRGEDMQAFRRLQKHAEDFACFLP